MQTIHLVACVSRKQSRSAPAELMYQSDWFLKASAYARRHADRWYILSAKYGLLAPHTVIQPYDITLAKGMSKADRQDWARKVCRDLLRVTTSDDRLVFLAGQKYREYLIPCMQAETYIVEVPMAGLGIGEQLAWLKRQLDAD
ncbi:MAG: hypothetical protein OIN84_05115 [Candidatus Methanoperedens sp.]|nr:hypothetical protein [Candidatus Methanoperedens sp.]